MNAESGIGKVDTLTATRETGAYRLRLAGAEADVAAVQRLRFEVFNLELAEGLAGSCGERARCGRV